MVHWYSPSVASVHPPNAFFFGPNRVHNQNGISIGSAVLHSSPHSVPVLYNGPALPLSKLPLPMGAWTPSNTWFLGPTRVLNPISIGSAVFAGLTTVTDRQTTLLGL